MLQQQNKFQQHRGLCPARSPKVLVRCTATATATSAPLPASVAKAPEPSTPAPSPSSALHVYYRTGWKKAFLHGSLCGGPWQDFELKPVPSAPGKWMAAHLQLPAGCSGSAPVLEFVTTNRSNDWDKPGAGGNYVIPSAGRYTLRGGAVAPVGDAPPVMVVSDLDGTMVGDDSATAAFKAWWEDVAVPRGGVLVYNTGRSLQSFEQLLKDKAYCLAHPDALISAVGTKVYEFDGTAWREDAAWSSALDEGWDLGAARDACYKALAQAGKGAMHFRPPEEQNPHKVTVGVHVGALDQALTSISSDLEASRVQANVITSGHGDWRFVDIVPRGAGKLQALHHVRVKHGFPVHAAVACGDSGNDILMLAGTNPAIIVGNAQPDLLAWAQQRLASGEEGQQQGQAAAAALAGGGAGSGKQRLYLAPKHEALSILEGLVYFGFK